LSPTPLLDASTRPSIVASNSKPSAVAVVMDVPPHAAGELAVGHYGHRCG
jgi:hypothetical protein